MRWYLNDASVQGQFDDPAVFQAIIIRLAAARERNALLRADLRMTRLFSNRPVTAQVTVRRSLQQLRDRDLKSIVLIWLDRSGPFLEDDRQYEVDDYFECLGADVTDTGLGEAARRIKHQQAASTFSFEGGLISFAVTPLVVDHGLFGDRLGQYLVDNVWTIDALLTAAAQHTPRPDSWKALVETARARFPRLLIPDAVFLNPSLAREPFEAGLRDRVLVLLGYLDAYMSGRRPDGAEDGAAREIIEKFFVGDRALFSPESPTNQNDFRNELTFPDPSDSARRIFAHFHGKISRRHFRLHFEWPVPSSQAQLKVVYLGPKITKS